MSKIFYAFKENEVVIRRIVAKYRPGKEDVEDLMQETFIKCFAADLKETIRDPKAFILRVAKNVAISEAKRKRHSTTTIVEDYEGPEVYEGEEDVSLDSQLYDRRQLSAFLMVLAELPVEQQRALVMRKVEGLKFKQIATRLDVSVSTVEKRVAAALLYCQDRLRQHGYDLSEFSKKFSQTENHPAGFASDILKHADIVKKL